MLTHTFWTEDEWEAMTPTEIQEVEHKQARLICHSSRMLAVRGPPLCDSETIDEYNSFLKYQNASGIFVRAV